MVSENGCEGLAGLRSLWYVVRLCFLQMRKWLETLILLDSWAFGGSFDLLVSG